MINAFKALVRSVIAMFMANEEVTSLYGYYMSR